MPYGWCQTDGCVYRRRHSASVFTRTMGANAAQPEKPLLQNSQISILLILGVIYICTSCDVICVYMYVRCVCVLKPHS